jgi:hypothetical protein
MPLNALFGVSVLMSFVAFGLATKLYFWPRIVRLPRDEALTVLIVPHAFRFVGLSFLVPGVVNPALQTAFAAPAAYGDLIAAALAVIAALTLKARKPWAIPVVWLFNLWGTADLLFAIWQGQLGVGIDVRDLGAAFYIPTVLVPPLLILHALIFKLLISPPSPPASRNSGP